MSDRDPGDVYPYASDTEGLYDLTNWNPTYWQRFADFLRFTHEREIFVQLEIWDRFDLSDAKDMHNWQRHPYNPANNTTYTAEETGFAKSYLDHPSKDLHPFYHTIPEMPQYQPRYDRLRKIQEQYLDKILSYSLDYGHVLYCMNNETSTDPRWGKYWMQHIHQRAANAGVQVYTTDMFDDAHRAAESVSFSGVLNDTDCYDFVEISQVNSRNFGETHWERIRWVCQQAHSTTPARPVNHTKVYSDGGTGWGSGTPQEGIARFWRNVLAGSAAVRFHRPTSG